MTEEGWDINEEYERLFGKAKRVNLFDSEEEYSEHRCMIMSESQEPYVSKDLPFEGVEDAIKLKQLENKRKKATKQGLSLIIESLTKYSNCKFGEILSILLNKSLYSILHNKEEKPDQKDGPKPHQVIIKHLFSIKEKGQCDARGYYNEDDNYFYICKDSLVSKDRDAFFVFSDVGVARDYFLRKACTEGEKYYRVNKDSKCRNASAAAAYVLGRQADYSFWKDEYGKTLADIYPKNFQQPIPMQEEQHEKKEPLKKESRPRENENVKAPKVGRPPRYYYISRGDMGNRSCNAKGMYDKQNDIFVIFEGSVLAQEVTSSFRFSASDIKRRKFIQLNCDSKNGYKLKRDAICNSPDEAACFVLGEKANGWVEWKSKDGIPLESYICKI